MPPPDPTAPHEPSGAGAPTDLADRYGVPSRWRRVALLTAAVTVVVAFGGWLGWTIWEQARPQIASGELRFEIVSDREIVATFTVDLADGVDPADTTCELRAQAVDKSLVGRLVFAPQPDARNQVTQSVTTVQRATAVDLIGCTTEGQQRPR
ncbi:DUF4307 domain-containing protein [Nocardioides sp. R-C-SC26]|uniref:DUF4307 domain-containing protein n=1 Tax=Nocardioides sp. R-C-SC26 TaxID=2870414 RepID=UPI001E61C62A|nr:DUF4307 domain-containing protein [Nocardioides sp. R-C-SC26]